MFLAASSRLCSWDSAWTGTFAKSMKSFVFSERQEVDFIPLLWKEGTKQQKNFPYILSRKQMLTQKRLAKWHESISSLLPSYELTVWQIGSLALVWKPVIFSLSYSYVNIINAKPKLSVLWFICCMLFERVKIICFMWQSLNCEVFRRSKTHINNHNL